MNDTAYQSLTGLSLGAGLVMVYFLVAALFKLPPFKKRRYSALAMLVALFVGVTATSVSQGIVPERPKAVSEAEWRSRIQSCNAPKVSHETWAPNDCLRETRSLSTADADAWIMKQVAALDLPKPVENTPKSAVVSADEKNGTAPASVAEGDAKQTLNTNVSAKEPSVESVQSRWRYSESRDEMRNATTKTACLRSTNELEFDFPYSGGSWSEICVRDSPQFGKDVWVRVEKGQFTCFMDCAVRAKFDEGVVQSFSAGSSSDGSSDVVFLTNYSRFVAATKQSKRIVVEANFYQSGSHQMVFEDAGGLEWPR